jgi:hypothetical protein
LGLFLPQDYTKREKNKNNNYRREDKGMKETKKYKQKRRRGRERERKDGRERTEEEFIYLLFVYLFINLFVAYLTMQSVSRTLISTGASWFPSLPTGRFLESTFKLSPDRTIPHPLQDLQCYPYQIPIFRQMVK